MKDKQWALFGVAGPLVAFIFIGISIALVPWFSWWNNALSDLGHAVHSRSAPYFNFGLLLAGLLITVFTVTVFWKHAKYTSPFLMMTAFALQLVAVFDEVYGQLHGTVSVIFFVFLILSCLVYAIEKRSILGVLSFVIGLGVWILFGERIIQAGIAVPEIISVVAATSWVILSALKIYYRSNLATK
jgi:hypothetical membrane protein